ncbi:MAG: cytochrome-c peroxidase, partial [Limisphaerales bacterium]
MRAILVQFPSESVKLQDVEEPTVLTALEVVYEGGSLDGKAADFPTRDLERVVAGPMKSIVPGLRKRNRWKEVRPDGHAIAINGRQNIPGAIGCGILLCLLLFMQSVFSEAIPDDLNRQLREILARNQFTGQVESTLEKRLGRRIDPAKAQLGRLLFFDKFVGLHGDNSCAGCHSPMNGFGDSQSIAIGVENNDFVGPRRMGPRNQRRTPSVVNTAFYPNLMWNGRFSAISGDPFDNS